MNDSPVDAYKTSLSLNVQNDFKKQCWNKWKAIVA